MLRRPLRARRARLAPREPSPAWLRAPTSARSVVLDVDLDTIGVRPADTRPRFPVAAAQAAGGWPAPIGDVASQRAARPSIRRDPGGMRPAATSRHRARSPASGRCPDDATVNRRSLHSRTCSSSPTRRCDDGHAAERRRGDPGNLEPAGAAMRFSRGGERLTAGRPSQPATRASSAQASTVPASLDDGVTVSRARSPPHRAGTAKEASGERARRAALEASVTDQCGGGARTAQRRFRFPEAPLVRPDDPDAHGRGNCRGAVAGRLSAPARTGRPQRSLCPRPRSIQASSPAHAAASARSPRASSTRDARAEQPHRRRMPAARRQPQARFRRVAADPARPVTEAGGGRNARGHTRATTRGRPRCAPAAPPSAWRAGVPGTGARTAAGPARGVEQFLVRSVRCRCSTNTIEVMAAIPIESIRSSAGMRRFRSGESEQHMTPRACGRPFGPGTSRGWRARAAGDRRAERRDACPSATLAARAGAPARRSRPGRSPAIRALRAARSRGVRSPAPGPPAISMLIRPAGTDALERFAQAFEHMPAAEE